MASDTYASVDLANIGSDNGLMPVQHQAIIWTNACSLYTQHQHSPSLSVCP